jgi:HEAT repeat protein
MFQKGQSGNPGGRPKEDAEVKALARTAGPEAIEKLLELMRGDDRRTALAAAQALLDRGFGKPGQSVELTGAEGGPVEALTRIELVAMRGNGTS